MTMFIIETKNSYYLVKSIENGKFSAQRIQTKVNCGTTVSLFSEPLKIGDSWTWGENKEFLLLDGKNIVLKTTKIERVFSWKESKKRQKDEMDLL